MKAKAESRVSIIEAVKSPLGFFTLCILGVEAILVTLSARATGLDFTILLVGLLLGFVVLLAMVYLLATRRALGGTEQPLPNYSDFMSLTDNDVRVLKAISEHDIFHPGELENYVERSTTPLDRRLGQLKKIGLIEYRNNRNSTPYVRFTEGTDDFCKMVKRWNSLS